MRTFAVVSIGVCLLLSVTSCAATWGNGGTVIRSGGAGVSPIQMGGDVSVIGGIYRCNLGGTSNP